LICKPIYCGLQVISSSCFSAYTHTPNPNDLQDDIAIKLCPTYLQEEIERIEDVRVTFFGEKHFAVSIRSEESLIDWRRPGTQLEYRQINLEDDFTNACYRFMSELGIVYGAFDFIRNKQGQLYFLEVNPAGEWAWLEQELGLNMRSALLELIEGLKAK
jgi:glutathione synthase/RimK-type ligase-like ATP-grasp enzyme